MLQKFFHKLTDFIAAITIAGFGLHSIKFFVDQYVYLGYTSAIPLAGISMVFTVIGLLMLVESVYGKLKK